MEYQKHKTRISIAIDLKKLKMAWINGVCPTSHYRRKVMVEGHNQRQGPPPTRNTFRIFHKISEQQQFLFVLMGSFLKTVCYLNQLMYYY